MWLLIQHTAIACLDLEAMHLPDAHKFQEMLATIHASPHHAVKIHNVLPKMVLPNALVFHHTLAMHTATVAGLSAFIIRIVPVEWPAFDNIAEIHALEYAVQMPNAMWSIMCQFVHVQEIIKEIRSLAAD